MTIPEEKPAKYLEPTPKTSTSKKHWSDEVGRRAPNVLTGLRFLAVPVFVFLLANPTPSRDLWACGLFLAATFTDWLDGYLARIYHAESILGKMLDPLADKILVAAALVMLAADPSGARVPAWMVVVLLSREFVVTGLRSIASLKGVVVESSRWAKHKTAWTFLGIVCLVVNAPYTILGVLIDFQRAGYVFLWIALIFSVGTGLDYAVSLRRMFWESDEASAT